MLEIRRDFGVGMITAFIRIEGRPFGLIAKNPKHLGGAIDAPAGDKAARFMQLCEPLIFRLRPFATRQALGRSRGRNGG